MKFTVIIFLIVGSAHIIAGLFFSKDPPDGFFKVFLGIAIIVMAILWWKGKKLDDKLKRYNKFIK